MTEQAWESIPGTPIETALRSMYERLLNMRPEAAETMARACRENGYSFMDKESSEKARGFLTLLENTDLPEERA